MGSINTINKEKEMIDFKFLNNNDEWIGATWTYVRLENLVQYDYDIMEDNCYGIRSFLNQFPDDYIVSVIAITGPNRIVHHADNPGIGWGFDITTDLIKIDWVRYRGE